MSAKATGIPESVALRSWCPFTRAAWAKSQEDGDCHTIGAPVGFNRALIRPGGPDLSIGRCIGAECMAWRTGGSREISSEKVLVGLTKLRTVRNIERVGFCGLSGPPGIDDDALVLAPASPLTPKNEG